MDAWQIKQELANRLERFCSEFLPGGRVDGHYYRCGGVNGGSGKSLVVHMNGKRRGDFYENAPEGGEVKTKGSILDLFMAANGISNVGDALKAAKKWCGLRDDYQRAKASNTFAPPTEKIKDETKKTKFIRKYERWPVQEDSEVGKYLTIERGIPLDVLRKYNVLEGMVPWLNPDAASPQKWIQLPSIIFEFYVGDEFMGSKYLALLRDEKGGKMIRADSGMTEEHQHIWGMKSVPDSATSIVLCEGEIDAMSAAACGFNAVSIPFGAKGDGNKWIENDFEWLDRFQEIKICMDSDEAGRREAAAIIPRLNPARVETVEIYEPYKDANELYLENPDYLKSALENSQAITPDKLKHVREYAQAIWEEFFPPDGKEPGYALPFNCPEFRVRLGEVSVMSGYPKHGKTNMLNWLVNCLAAMYGVITGVCSLEIKAEKTLRNLMRQAIGQRKPTDEDGKPSKELFRRGINYLDAHFIVFTTVGRAKVREILEAFSWAVRKYGLHIVIIDSFMKLDASKDDLDRQAEIMDELCCWARDNNVHVFLVAHSRKPQNKDNPENHLPRPDEVEGSGDITKQAHNTIITYRNKKKEKALLKAKIMRDEAEIDEQEKQHDAVF